MKFLCPLLSLRINLTKRIQSVGNLINQIDWYCWHYFSSPLDMKVKECVHNLTQLRLDIGSSVNISEETISTILEASISHSKVKD